MKSVRSVLLAAMLAGGLAVAPVTFAKPPVPPATVPTVAVGPQYDTTHVCVAPEDFDRFTDSFVATFGGKKSKQGVFQVTPTPSQTMSQLVLTPVGTISVFGFKTPIPYPFCAERTGYLVTDMDVAVKSAREHGADVIVDTFPDPIGRDAIITWAGGVNMQLYWHTQAPNYDALQTIPENRVYVSPQSVRKFVHDFVKFSKGKVVSDNLKAPGIEIGRPDDTYRRIRIESGFGKMTVLVTDGHLPYPFGREMTGYDVPDLAATLKQAEAAGVTVLVPPFKSDGRDAALVQFPGGYVAEIHASAAR
ncbi:glyoxalase [Burkholderia orbicola]|uniref:glyoxalase n=1 Tax=Burkholderia orbicola TaxID=2978683 RepID=UPI0026527F9B|nr:glyoxalase [Burkholderia orbicola]MDN7774525.1 glyoxalase [Burkholderia orbicola]MDN7994592.1 glyoxalase [Burkholderia orbicola]